MNNQRILTLIAIVMLGVFIVMAYDYNTQRRDETVGEQIDEAVEEVQDEIDDHTTAR